MSCRICLENDGNLIAPCLCSGSMKYVHKKCLDKWLIFKQTKHCEVCGIEYSHESLISFYHKNIETIKETMFILVILFYEIIIYSGYYFILGETISVFSPTYPYLCIYFFVNTGNILYLCQPLIPNDFLKGSLALMSLHNILFTVLFSSLNLRMTIFELVDTIVKYTLLYLKKNIILI